MICCKAVSKYYIGVNRCGIAGVLHFENERKIDKGILEWMTKVLSHRGDRPPENETIGLGSPAVLRWAHRRGQETETAYGGTAHHDAQGCPGGHRSPRDFPQSRHLGRYVLYMAAKSAGLEVSDVKKLRQLEDENRRL